MIFEKVLAGGIFLSSVFYPLLASWGEAKWGICLLTFVWGLKAGLDWVCKKQKLSFVIFGLFVVMSLVDIDLATFYPSLLNLAFCIFFILSLRSESIITKFAQLEHRLKKLPSLTQSEIAYTRFLTKIWSGVFLWNALFSLFLLVMHKKDWWALYSGIGGYVLAGFVFFLERCLRNKIKEIFFYG